MNEALRPSAPADVTLEVIYSATEMQHRSDEYIRNVYDPEYIPDHATEVEPVKKESLADLTSKLPLTGQEVDVYGRRLEQTGNPEHIIRGITHLVVAQTISDDPAVGICRGIESRRAYDSMVLGRDDEVQEIIRDTLIHVVQTGEESQEIDLMGRRATIRPELHVCVEGGRIYPREPINAHSVKVTQHDRRSLQIIDILNQRASLKTRLIDLRTFVNEWLVNERYSSRSLNHSRLSLANRMLAEEVEDNGSDRVAIVSDAVKEHPHFMDDKSEFKFISSGKPIEMRWSHLAVLPGYFRNYYKPGKAIFTGQLEVFLRGETENGKRLSAPLRDVEEIF